jgi:hypothetical protein
VDRIVLLVVLGGLAVGVALLLRSRAGTDAPTRPTWAVPGQVDRTDLPRPDAPWLVAVFSSSTCTACRATWEKARQLESDEVAVCDLDSVADAELHRRYGIDAVPLVLIADADGRVRGSFLGEPPAADLWKAVADAREGADDEG